MGDYYMFVDASGDDGLKFDKGSSLCYVASGVIVHKDDIEHNITVLGLIKQLMGAKAKDEIKYSKVRRHPRRVEIHRLLKDIKGSAYSFVVFKRLTESLLFLNPATKALSSFSHVLAIVSMAEHFKKDSSVTVQVVIDRMKETEESAVKRLLIEYDLSERTEKLPNHSISYRDSKAEGYELIQLADIVSGLTRSHFENHNSSEALSLFWRLCPLCFGPNKVLCKRKRLPSADGCPLFFALPLYRNNPNANCLKSLTYEPSKIGKHFRYLYCPKMK